LNTGRNNRRAGFFFRRGKVRIIAKGSGSRLFAVTNPRLAGSFCGAEQRFTFAPVMRSVAKRLISAFSASTPEKLFVLVETDDNRLFGRRARLLKSPR
jgi:hypothetical protein